MKQTSVRILACALVGTVVLTGANFGSDATGLSAKLPVEGLALALEEGTPFEAIKEEVEKNNSEKEGLDSFKDIEDKLSQSEEPTYSFDIEQTTEENSTDEDSTEESSTEENSTEVTSEEDGTKESSTEEESTEETSEEKTTVEEETTEETSTEEEISEEEKEFSSLVIAQVTNYVNVRDTASEEGEIVGKLYDKSVGTYISEKDGWYKINSGNVTGYVKAEYCVTGEAAIELAKKVGERIAVVNTTTLKVRKEPGMDAPVLGLIPIEDELSVIEELDGWVKVNIEEGDGYVSSEFVNLRTDFVKAESKAEEEARLKKEEKERKEAQAAAEKATRENSKKETEKTESSEGGKVSEPMAISGGSSAGNAVASFATQFVGNPYVYGGTSLTNGADCSGFVMSVYNNFGVSLPHSSGALRSKGSDVGGLGNAQPGDIVCYSGHVGLYIGNGQIVHASTKATGIKISDASYRKVLAVRRIF